MNLLEERRWVRAAFSAANPIFAYTTPMYIIAIGWAYVVLLMAVTAKSFTAGVLTFIFYGLLPLALFLWLTGTRQRRRSRRLAQERLGEPDRADSKPDQ